MSFSFSLAAPPQPQPARRARPVRPPPPPVPTAPAVVDRDAARRLQPLFNVERHRKRVRPPAANDGQKRRTYVVTDDKDRETVVNLFANNNMLPEEIEAALRGKVTIHNIRHILEIYRNTNRIHKKRKGGSRPLYDTEEQQLVAQIQHEHHEFTYRQIRDLWQRVTGSSKRLSNGTISTILHRYGITTKALRTEPLARNTPRLISERFRYAQSQIAIESANVIYVDEMGFNLHRKRGRGRSLVGHRAITKRANSKGGNVSVCAAISPKTGLVKYTAKIGGFNNMEYARFLNEIMRDYAPVRRYTHYFVMDNVRFHHHARVVALFEGVRILQKQIFIPAYSPQLNTIEECFSSIAWFVNQRRVDNRAGLLPLIDDAFKTITAAKCLKWHETVVKWLQHCLEKKPIGSFPGEDVSSLVIDDDNDDDDDDDDVDDDDADNDADEEEEDGEEEEEDDDDDDDVEN